MASEKATDKHFGEFVRKERDAKKWTQQEMAAKVNTKVQMHYTTLAKIEKGERSVRIAEAVAIADVLGVSLDRLLGRRAGVANEIADIVSNLQHAAGKASLDVGAIHAAIQGWFAELGEIEFDGYQELQQAGGAALKALAVARDELYAITMVEAPQRVAQSRIDQLIEEKANEKTNQLLAKLMKMAAEGEKE